MNQAAKAQTTTPTTTPTAMPTVEPDETAAVDEPVPLLSVPLLPVGDAVVVVSGELELDGFRPNGQKSPPLGGSTQVRESPSLTVWKSDCVVRLVVVRGSIMKGAGFGTLSLSLHSGPRAPMNEVLPTISFSWTVKFVAEVIATP
jgi:hypothetical protein